MAPALRLLLAFLAIGSCIAADNIDLWPMPVSVSHGTQKLYVKKDIAMSMVGSTYSDEKAILKDAFQRMVDLVTMNHVVDGINQSSLVLTCVNIVVHSPGDEVICSLDLINCRFIYRLQHLFLLILCIAHLLQLNFGVDESYNLTVPTTGDPLYAQIEVSKSSVSTETLKCTRICCNSSYHSCMPSASLVNMHHGVLNSKALSKAFAY